VGRRYLSYACCTHVTFLHPTPIQSIDLTIMASHNISFADACTAQAIPAPQLFGLEILDVRASPVTNFSLSAILIQFWTKSEFAGLNFCNVTIQYTHPG
jgi:hypothetical protein